MHKTANVLDALPKRVQPRAKALLHEIMEAPSREAPGEALEGFRSEFDAKYPKAVAKLDRDRDALFTFYDFPAEHWRHLRTTNPIESSPATVKLRTRVTKGAGSKRAALAMAYKLLDQAQQSWRAFNGSELVREVLDESSSRTVSGSQTTKTQRRTRGSPPDAGAPTHPQHLTVALAGDGAAIRCAAMWLLQSGRGPSEIALSASYLGRRVRAASRSISKERSRCHQRQFRWSRVSVRSPGSR